MEYYGAQATDIYNLMEFVEEQDNIDKDNYTTYCEIILDNLDLVKKDFKFIGKELSSYYKSGKIEELTDEYVKIKIDNYLIKVELEDNSEYLKISKSK
jgi:hypothetical protein